MKKILLFGLLVILFSILIVAQEEHDFNEAKQLIDSKISCDNLTNEQLESIGDYYMEQMHPGEAHELMHEMMGGHDSEVTKNMHINIASSIYCGETNQSMMGMMNMMASGNGMMGDNMMGEGMMNMRGGNMMTGDNVIDEKNMMYKYGNYNLGFTVISWITYILIIILIVSTIYWLIKSANMEK